MIFQENDFLKTYNDMNKLWESAGEPGISDLADPDSFEAIIQQAMAQVTAPDTFDRSYWRSIRSIIDLKCGRSGQYASATWYSRFLTFYLTYKVEEAICRELRNTFKLNIDFLGGKNAEKLYLLDQDRGQGFTKAEPDFEVIIDPTSYDPRRDRLTIECKTLGATSSVHGADLLISHTPLDKNGSANQTCEFMLTGGFPQICMLFAPDKLQDYINTEGNPEAKAAERNEIIKTLRFENNYKFINSQYDESKLQNRQSLSKEQLYKAVSKRKILGGSVDISLPSDNLVGLFTQVNKLLITTEIGDGTEGELEAVVSDYTTRVLDRQTQAIGNSLSSLTKNKTKLANVNLPSADKVEAEANVVAAATQLATALVDKSI